jgi:hypothetical protein
MDRIDWARTLRTLLVAGALLIALLAAVLGLIGASGPADMWAVGADSTLPSRVPAALVRT